MVPGGTVEEKNFAALAAGDNINKIKSLRYLDDIVLLFLPS